VAFSISASEPRMMVLRNLVGKLMAWCNDQKIFLKRRPWDERGGSNASLTGKVALIDMFQDEGNRVGCYALWDSFTDLVNTSDLKFIEGLAEQMENMNAESDSLNLSREPTTEKDWTYDKCTSHVLEKLRRCDLDESLFKKTRLALKKSRISGKDIMSMLSVEQIPEDDRALPEPGRAAREVSSRGEIDTVLDGIGVKDPQVLYLVRTFMKEIRDKIIMHKQNQESGEYTKDDLLDSKLETLANLCHAEEEEMEVRKKLRRLRLAWRTYDLLEALGDRRFSYS
jgi:hypothetical protein